MPETETLENAKNPAPNAGIEDQLAAITKTEQTNTIANTQLTSPMEVHHHPQLHHKPKPWKEYLLEGLMIFIAVTMGFIAENIREYIVEAHTEKEFIKSIVADLKKDSASLTDNLKNGPVLTAYWDSLANEIKTNPLKGNEKKLYHFFCLAFGAQDFPYFDRTVTQLRNGGFRLIKHPDVSDAIMTYDVLMRQALYQSRDANNGYWAEVSHETAEIFDLNIAYAYTNAAKKYPSRIDSVHYPDNLKLLNYDMGQIGRWLSFEAIGHNADIQDFAITKRLLNENHAVDSLIEKEYQINNQ